MKQWRKEYSSQYKRKLDEQLGFVLGVVVNVGLYFVSRVLARWVVTNGRSVDDTAGFIIIFAPWVLNLVIIGWGLMFRQGVAIGYLYFFAYALLFPIVLGVAFIGSCIVSLPLWFIVGLVIDGLGLPSEIGDVTAFLLFGLVILLSLYGTWRILWKPFSRWWRDYGLPGDWEPAE